MAAKRLGDAAVNIELFAPVEYGARQNVRLGPVSAARVGPTVARGRSSDHGSGDVG